MIEITHRLLLLSIVLIALGCGGSDESTTGRRVRGAPGAPEAPKSLEVLALTTSEIEFSWLDVKDEEAFIVEMKTGQGFFSGVRTLSSNITSYVKRGLEADTSYTFRIIARNQKGDSFPSNEATAKTKSGTDPPPPDPTTLQATALTAQIGLTWNDNSDNETAFVLERQPNASGQNQFGVIATKGANVTSHSDSSAQVDVTYTYRVKATNSAGSSGYSNTASATIENQPEIPNAPVTLTAVPQFPDAIELQWFDQSDNETSFVIERRPNLLGQNQFGELTTKPTNSQSHNDTPVDQDVTYEYRVYARNSAGSSGYTNTASAMISAQQVIPPQPTGMTATPRNNPHRVEITWTDNALSGDPANEDEFIIYRKDGGIGSSNNYGEIGRAVQDTPTYTDNSAVCEQTYTYVVTAINGAGETLASAPDQATLGICDPNKPIAPTMQGAQYVGPHVLITWSDNSSNEERFILHRKVQGGNFGLIAFPPANTESHENTPPPGNTYIYRIKARGEYLDSDWSDDSAPVVVP